MWLEVWSEHVQKPRTNDTIEVDCVAALRERQSGTSNRLHDDCILMIRLDRGWVLGMGDELVEGI